MVLGLDRHSGNEGRLETGGGRANGLIAGESRLDVLDAGETVPAGLLTLLDSLSDQADSDGTVLSTGGFGELEKGVLVVRRQLIDLAMGRNSVLREPFLGIMSPVTGDLVKKWTRLALELKVSQCGWKLGVVRKRCLG